MKDIMESVRKRRKSRAESCKLYEDRRYVCHRCAEHPGLTDEYEYCPYSGEPIKDGPKKDTAQRANALVDRLRNYTEKCIYASTRGGGSFLPPTGYINGKERELRNRLGRVEKRLKEQGQKKHGMEKRIDRLVSTINDKIDNVAGRLQALEQYSDFVANMAKFYNLGYLIPFDELEKEVEKKNNERLAPISRVNIGWEAVAETSPYNGEMTEVRFNEVIDGYPTKDEALKALVEKRSGQKEEDCALSAKKGKPAFYSKTFPPTIEDRLDKIEERLTEIEGVLSSIGSPDYDLRKKVEALEIQAKHFACYIPNVSYELKNN